MALLLLAAIALGVFLRFDNLTLVGTRGSDTIYYTNIARSWADGDRVFRIAGGTLAYRPVVYAVYAAAISVLGFHDWTLKVLNATIDSANIALVFLLCFLLSRRDALLSLIAASSYALLPGAILLAREELVHVTSTFLVLGCAILFVVSMGRTQARWRWLLLVAAGLLAGLAALTHEELVFCVIGYAGVLLWDHRARRERAPSWHLPWEWLLLGAPAAAVALQIYLVNTDAGVELTLTGHSEPYLPRLLRFAWNGVVGLSSSLFAYTLLLLLTAVGARALRRTRRRTHPDLARPIDHLPLAVALGYLVAYAFFFERVLYERTFLPMFALLTVWAVVQAGQLLSRSLAPGRMRAVILTASVALVPFNLDQFPSFFSTPRWYAGPIPRDFDPGHGLRTLRGWSSRVVWPRRLHDALGTRVNEKARLLVASSMLYPYPGRRGLQLDYYFGDDAILIIDHTEPLEELIERYRVKFIVANGFLRSERVLSMDEYQAYRYGGRWSERIPLRLGSSYGFAPGEYSPRREAEYVHEFAMARGARMLAATDGTLLYFLGTSDPPAAPQPPR